MKLINDEQFADMQGDLMGLVGQITKLRTDFDVKGLKEEILNEFKESLRNSDSLFNRLEEEALELKQNLVMLKDVRREFIICKNVREWKIFFFSLFSFFLGAGSIWILFKFGFIS